MGFDGGNLTINVRHVPAFLSLVLFGQAGWYHLTVAVFREELLLYCT
jgi:hypothetical protein